MAIVQRSILVARPIEETFDYVAAFENAVRWNPAVITSERLSAGLPHVGSLYQLVVEFGRGTTPMRYEITNLDRPMRLELVGEGEQLRSLEVVRFTDLYEDTRITWRAEMRLRGPRGLFGLAGRRAFNRVADAAMEGLQHALIR
jgi:hypothetical protein